MNEIKKIKFKDCNKIIKLVNNGQIDVILDKVKKDFINYVWDDLQIQVISHDSIFIVFKNLKKMHK